MPSRFRPNTDATRTNALDAAFNKANVTPVPQRPFTADQYAALTIQRTSWEAATDTAAMNLGLQAQAVNAAEDFGVSLEQHISHFFQVFNFGVARGLFAASDRAFYKLDMSQTAAPAVTSHADRLLWAHNIATGETARHTAAGQSFKPMAMPSADEVADALASYLGSLEPASNAKDNYEAAQKAVQVLRPGADAVILDLWDSIEFAFRQEDAATLRRKAREWGVVYVPRPGETPDPTPTPATPPPPAPPAA